MKSKKEILDRIRHLKGREKDGVDVSHELSTLVKYENDSDNSAFEEIAYMVSVKSTDYFRKIRTLMWMLES